MISLRFQNPSVTLPFTQGESQRQALQTEHYIATQYFYYYWVACFVFNVDKLFGLWFICRSKIECINTSLKIHIQTVYGCRICAVPVKFGAFDQSL